MSYCCVGNCTKKHSRDSSTLRHFLRFYRFPKDAVLAKKWVDRIGRMPRDINTDKMVVCSDHFEEEDFNFRQYQHSLQLYNKNESLKGTNITLKDDAIPNTDRSSGLKRIRSPCSDIAGQPSRNRRKRNVALERIEELIEENITIVGDSDDGKLGQSMSQDDVLEKSKETNEITPYSTVSSQPDSVPIIETKSIVTQTDFSCKCFPSSKQQQQPVFDTESEDDESDSEVGDPSYQLQNISESGTAHDTWKERRYFSKKEKRPVKTPISAAIVGMEQLKLLFVYCLLCGSRILSTAVRYSGVAVAIDYICAMGHQHTWRSGDIFHKKYHMNVKIAASSMMSGVGFAKLKAIFGLVEIPLMTKKKFYQLGRTWLFPEISSKYRTMKDNTILELKTVNEVMLSGDGQFDSPGYSAKYCTYTMMQCMTNKVVDFFVIQKGQYDGELEKQACEELLNILINENELPVNSFVSDCHSAIAKMIREQYPNLYHGYDIWHTAKRLRKKLDKAGKKYPKILAWTSDLVNHFWWSCKACKGNSDLLLELFHSSLFHVLNVHSWSRRTALKATFAEMRGKKPYPKAPTLAATNQKCLHKPLTKGIHRKGKWFTVHETDFLALFKIVTNTRLCNDMRHCEKFLHTGALESFHSAKLKYLPKSSAFKMDTHVIMTMLTALEHNYSLTAPTLTQKVAAYSRAQKMYILKNYNKRETEAMKKDILIAMNNNIKDNKTLTLDLSSYVRKPIPKTFHKVEKPSKDILIAQALSRILDK